MSRAKQIRESCRLWALDWLRNNPHSEPHHNLRFALTLEVLEGLPHENILDVGGESIFTTLMRERWPASKVDATGDIDVRTNGFDSTQTRDLVVFTEVIEHLHDLHTYHQDYDTRARWTGSGQLACLHHICQCMCIGAYLFITTPNAAGLRVLWNTLHGLPPITYDPHVRELTMPQLQSLVLKTGLEICDSGTWTCWHHHNVSNEDVDRLMRIISQMNGPMEGRGDDLWLIARKV